MKKKMVALLNKFTVFCLSNFVGYFLKFKFILFYDRVVYCFTGIFLILLSYPIYISKVGDHSRG